MQIQMASQIGKALTFTGTPSSEVLTVQGIVSKDVKYRHCDFLLELEAPFLASMSDHELARLNTIISSAHGIL